MRNVRMLNGPMWIWIVFICLIPMNLQAQFDSGSDGSDGALDLTVSGTIIFDPTMFSPPLDQDGDGIYHFTTINVASGVTVKFIDDVLGNKPVVWLASGDVTIEGTLDLSGESGHRNDEQPRLSNAGPGGFKGGAGATSFSPGTSGFGPGGAGGTYPLNDAGHVTAQDGAIYGNIYLLPLIGGFGGGGGTDSPGAGGGAGGGAILIACSTTLTVNGQILARAGGDGNCSDCSSGSGTQKRGGYGSGGAIRLMASVIGGNGTIHANSPSSRGSDGRIRIEAFQHEFVGSDQPEARFVTPGIIFPTAANPIVRVVRVNGVSVPANPFGSFNPADLQINANSDVTIEIEASNIPLGTMVDLTIWSESNGSVTLQSTPLAGTFENSTATATYNFPHGFAWVSTQASWTP